MQPLLKDQAFLRAAVAELEAYLLSKEIFWQLTPLKEDRKVGNLLSLTPGNLMLSLIKVKHYPWGGADLEYAQALTRQIEGEIAKWRTVWRIKIDREIILRIQQWQNYLAEASAEKALIDYPFNVRNRAILDCFENMDVHITPAQTSTIFLLDETLKRLTCDAPFIWEFEVANGFIMDVFWYLYRTPVKR